MNVSNKKSVFYHVWLKCGFVDHVVFDQDAFTDVSMSVSLAWSVGMPVWTCHAVLQRGKQPWPPAGMEWSWTPISTKTGKEESALGSTSLPERSVGKNHSQLARANFIQVAAWLEGSAMLQGPDKVTLLKTQIFHVELPSSVKSYLNAAMLKRVHLHNDWCLAFWLTSLVFAAQSVWLKYNCRVFYSSSISNLWTLMVFKIFTTALR